MRINKGLLVLDKHKKEILFLVKVSISVSILVLKEGMMIPIKNRAKLIMFSYGTSFMEPKNISNQHNHQKNPSMFSNLRTEANPTVFST